MPQIIRQNMLKKLKAKLAPKNQLVRFYQEGKLSQEEFEERMRKINILEAIEMEKEDWPEMHGARQDEEGNWEV